jgi:hypothetical protein
VSTPGREFHVFLASPGDVTEERGQVRAYFDHLNRTAAARWNARFQVVDWQTFASAGVGRPQKLITEQTLERFRPSLALVIVIMAQRFGSPSGEFESGTEEEVRWALEARHDSAILEVKFFFRDSQNLVFPADPAQLEEAFGQWKRVQQFRSELESEHAALVRTYPDPASFAAVLRADLDLWFHADGRPWTVAAVEPAAPPAGPGGRPPAEYFQNLVHAFRWLDIAGIDSDRAFKLPLDEIYVRLRLISAADDAPATMVDPPDAAAFDIQAALARYRRLVIVGDPGSGKSTFLRYIALVLGQAGLVGDPRNALERLSLPAPLPIPIFLSCWDLAEYLRREERAVLSAVLDFLADRLGESGWSMARADLARLLGSDRAILLIDGLDEVATEEGRHQVSDLIEDLVQRYPGNRYVVTSRIRAYTGETALGERFVRCDIQPFGPAERAAFLRNWVGQLLGGDAGADPAGREAATELAALAEAIETSSIRELADRPLLLTVIAIVHWNRKRLPEQRVDLYDECVDVLLGQRKDAEQRRASGDTRYFDPAYSRQRRYQRAFVRKRLAEIAYAMLGRAGEEIDRAAAVGLLARHFRTHEADSPQAAAEEFLDRQELRSGLLVRRGALAYRFVHLTFQEYLAAWHLAGRDLAQVLGEIEPHLREPTWFETLQLLGGALANRPDEYLDRYLGWLLDRAGATIAEQAPVIALAGNIVRDTQAVAALTPATTARYEQRLRETFDAFSAGSRVPRQTQLELLEALGRLGASVKDQLVSATHSRLLDVRRRAVEMLVPHLSDDDLFAMDHVLDDRSKEPIRTYVSAMVQRDPVRAGQVLLGRPWSAADKLREALRETAAPRLPAAGLARWPSFVQQLAGPADWVSAVALLDIWRDERPETHTLVMALAAAGVPGACSVLGRRWSTRPETWALLGRLARSGSVVALEALMHWRPDHRETWDVIRTRVADGAEIDLTTLVGRSTDRAALFPLVRDLAEAGSAQAMPVLAAHWPDRAETWAVLRQRAAAGSDDALSALVDAHSRQRVQRATWLIVWDRASAGSEVALDALVSWRSGDPQTWALVRSRAEAGSEVALTSLARWHDDDPATWRLVRTWAEAGSATALRLLVADRPDAAGPIVERRAKAGSATAVHLLLADGATPEELLRLLGEADDAAIAALCAAGADGTLTDLFRREPAPPGGRASRADRGWTALLLRLAEAGSEPATAALAELTSALPARTRVELMRRRAERGSRAALDHLLGLPGTRSGVGVFLRRLVEGGSEAAIAALADRPSLGGSAALLRRQAELGSESALSAITRRGVEPGDWALLERRAAEGSAVAAPLVAWRDWAVATGGPDVRTGLEPDAG